MKNVLVTGATGFIGSNLAAALVQEGSRVRIFRRATSDVSPLGNLDVEECIGDLRDVESLRKAVRGCDTVFHAGALVSYWRQQRAEMYDINITGTRNVVSACLEAGIERLVYTSSIAAVGFHEDGSLADENTPFNWEPYDVGYRISKYRAEHEVFKGIQLGLPAVVVNPAIVIGEGDIHFHGGQIVRDVYRKRIWYWVAGGMNIVYVGDVVRGHVKAAQLGRIGERYILAGENLTHKQVLSTTAEIVHGIRPLFELPTWFVHGLAWTAEALASIFDSKPWITRELMAGIGLHNWYSSEKAIKELGHTITPFRVAVQRTFDWYRQHQLL